MHRLINRYLILHYINQNYILQSMNPSMVCTFFLFLLVFILKLCDKWSIMMILSEIGNKSIQSSEKRPVSFLIWRKKEILRMMRSLLHLYSRNKSSCLLRNEGNIILQINNVVYMQIIIDDKPEWWSEMTLIRENKSRIFLWGLD